MNPVAAIIKVNPFFVWQAYSFLNLACQCSSSMSHSFGSQRNVAASLH